MVPDLPPAAGSAPGCPSNPPTGQIACEVLGAAASSQDRVEQTQQLPNHGGYLTRRSFQYPSLGSSRCDLRRTPPGLEQTYSAMRVEAAGQENRCAHTARWMYGRAAWAVRGVGRAKWTASSRRATPARRRREWGRVRHGRMRFAARSRSVRPGTGGCTARVADTCPTR